MFLHFMVYLSRIFITFTSQFHFSVFKYYLSPSLSLIVLTDSTALHHQLPDDDGQGLWVGPLLSQPHADGYGLCVQGSVQKSAHLCKSAEGLPGIHNPAPTTITSCSISHGGDTLEHNNI